ncbi:MAG: cytochrome c-type biogenesis protein CcmH [Chloroflexi bacterium]|nr:cytochrome c-type biogenesis protein CcmH [Chloroflexota bacterium]
MPRGNTPLFKGFKNATIEGPGGQDVVVEFVLARDPVAGSPWFDRLTMSGPCSPERVPTYPVGQDACARLCDRMETMPKTRWARAIVLLGTTLPLLFLLATCTQKPLTFEERALALDRRIMCPVCPGETIDQTQAEIGKQMRALVREKLREGWSDQQVLDYFADRYGPSILAAPPKGGFSALAWIAPPVGVALGLVLLGLVLRAMRRSSAAAGTLPATRREELEPYLNIVDREMESGVGLHPQPEGPPARRPRGRGR